MDARRRARLLALAGLAVAALIVLLLVRSAENPPAAPREDAAAPSPPEGPRTKARLDAARPRLAPTPPAPGSAPTTGPRVLHVHGSVIAPKGVPLAGARVHVTTFGEDPRADRSLAVVALRPDGTYDVPSLRLPDGVAKVRVVSEVPGFVTLWDEGVPGADGDVTVDLSLEKALATERPPWAGRVVDADGRPVADLPVFLEATPYEGTSIEAFRLDEGTGARLGSSGWPLGTLRGFARTDSEGRYTIRGLTCGGCGRLHSASPDWFILEDAGNRSFGTKNEAVTTAWRTARLVLSVVDAEDRPVAEFTVAGATAGAEGWTTKGRSGALDVLWPVPSRGGSTEVAVTAEGFTPAFLSLPTPRKGGVSRERVRLERVKPEQFGRLVVVASGPGAAGLEEPPKVELRPRGAAVVVERPILARLDGARWAATVPVGAWDYAIRPSRYPHGALVATGSVVVESRSDSEISWELPSFGALRVVWRSTEGAEALDVWLTLRSSVGAKLRVPYGPAVSIPTGEWDFDLVDARATVRATGRASIREGETVRLVIGPE